MPKLTKLEVSWIASYPKSGNTWVRCFLEALILGRLDINDLCLVRIDTNNLIYQAVCPKPAEKMSLEEQAILRPAACYWHAATNAHFPWPVMLKTHFQPTKLLTPLTGPSIYLVRDPRDVAVSLMRHTEFSCDQTIQVMGERGQVWKSDGLPYFAGSWSDHVTRWRKVPNTLLIKYEDMREDPAKHLAKIASHLGVQGTIADAIELCKLEKLRAHEKKNGFSEAHKGSFFGKGKVGGWKEVLTDRQEKAIVSQHGETMKVLGYI